MSNITILDDSEIANYVDLEVSGGLSSKVKAALDMYLAQLDKVGGDGFYDDDTSTAHAVIDELVAQVRLIDENMSDVAAMIDSLVHILQTSVIDKEDALANQIREE